jgi:hypothetical protein
MPTLTWVFNRHTPVVVLIRPHRVAKTAAHRRTVVSIEVQPSTTQHRTSEEEPTDVSCGRRRFGLRAIVLSTNHNTYRSHAAGSTDVCELLRIRLPLSGSRSRTVPRQLNFRRRVDNHLLTSIAVSCVSRSRIRKTALRQASAPDDTAFNNSACPAHAVWSSGMSEIMLIDNVPLLDRISHVSECAHVVERVAVHNDDVGGFDLSTSG